MKMNQLFRTSAPKAMIGALLLIAIVSSSMVQPVFATAAQRSTAISRMSSMRYFSWVPNGSVIIYGNQYAIGGSITGLPYTQNADTTYAGFLSSPTMQYVPGGNFYYFSQPSSDVGNDCSSAVAISWSAGGSSIIVSQVWTGQMLRAVKATENKMAKRGTYSTTYDRNSDGVIDTKDMCSTSNFSALVAGDGCFYRTSSGGHAILITAVNPATQTVSYIEQIGAGTGGWRLSSTNSTWTSGTKTFAQLNSAYFVPIRPTDI